MGPSLSDLSCSHGACPFRSTSICKIFLAYVDMTIQRDAAHFGKCVCVSNAPLNLAAFHFSMIEHPSMALEQEGHELSMRLRSDPDAQTITYVDTTIPRFLETLRVSSWNLKVEDRTESERGDDSTYDADIAHRSSFLAERLSCRTCFPMCRPQAAVVSNVRRLL